MTEPLTPILLPLGDRALLIRFSTELSDEANRAAIALARRLQREGIDGVEEIVPGLVSVMLRLRSTEDFSRTRGEVMLRMSDETGPATPAKHQMLRVVFDGEDLSEVAERLAMNTATFVKRHNARDLRVLATGFAPGFVYCGFHDETLILPRRESVRPMVPAGTVLFAAGQTAITSTPIRTGWHVIGRTEFQNFDPARDPPTQLSPGDIIAFEAAT